MKQHTRNLLSLFGFDAANRLLGFAATAYLARVLGASAFGVVSFGLAVLSYGILAASPGLHVIGTRMVSQRLYSEALVVRKVTGIRFVLSFLAGGLIVSGAWLLIRDSTMLLVVGLYAASLPLTALHIDWYFQGKERIGTIGAGKLGAAVVYLLLVLLFTRSPDDSFAVPLAYFGASAALAALLSIQYRRHRANVTADAVPSAPSLSWSSLIRQSLPVGFGAIMAQVVVNFPVILLGVFSTTRDIGDYSAAARLLFFFLVVDRAIYALLFPIISRTVRDNHGALVPLLERAIRYVLILAFPICIGGVIIARPLIVFLLGIDFEPASAVYQILSFHFLFTVVNSIFMYLLIAAGEEKRYLRVMSTVSVLSLVSLIPFTYYWGAAGAACVMAAGEGLVTWMMCREARTVAPVAFWRAVWRPLAAVAVMAGVLLLLPGWGLIVPAVVGAAVYTFGLIVFRGVRGDDVRFARERFL